MENKVRYQFDRLPMVLFLACLAVTVVAGSVAKRSIMKKNHHPHSHKRMSFPENFFFSFASRYLLLREKNFYVFRFHLVWFFVSLLIIKFFPCFFFLFIELCTHIAKHVDGDFYDRFSTRDSLA